jgi:hypothetical protein
MTHMRDDIDWNAEIRRRFEREYGESLAEDRVAEILEAAQLNRTSGTALDPGDDALHSLELLFDDLRSIEEDYIHVFVGGHLLGRAASQEVPSSEWLAGVPAPPRWTARAHAIMKRYIPLQQAVLQIFSADQFVAREDLYPLLTSVASADSQQGDVVAVELPPGADEDSVIGRLGVHANPWFLAMRYLSERHDAQSSRGQLTFDEWLRAEREGTLSRLTRLGKLSFLIEHIAEETGCERWQALSFLLCGEVPELPWVRVRRTERPAVGDTWQIQVGGPDVSAADVGRAYEAARASTSASPGEGRDAIEECRKLCDFVRPLRERGVSWAEVRERWNALPGAKRYEKTKTMEVAYLRARRRLDARQVGDGRR